MTLGTILIIFLVLAILAVLPIWEYSRDWGHAPATMLIILLVIIACLAAEGML